MKLKLKTRKYADTLFIPITTVNQIINTEKDEERLKQYDSLLSEKEYFSGVSDVVHLKKIINWSPDNGFPVTELIKWFSLAEKVNELNINESGEIELTENEISLIKERILNPKFIINKNSLDYLAYVEFLRELIKELNMV